MMKKITMMQQRSTDQLSTVHSRRHLTNFKMLDSLSSSPETVCLAVLRLAVLRQSV